MKKQLLLICLLSATILGFNFSVIANCPNDTFSVNSNSPVCSGAALNLLVSGGMAYAWSGPNGFSSTLPNPSISNVSSSNDGTYYVTITGTGGCLQNDTIIVQVAQLPNASITPSGPVTICAGEELALGVAYPTGTTALVYAPGASGSNTTCNCPPGYIVTGYTSHSGAVLDNFSLACRQLNRNGTLGDVVSYTPYNGVSGGGSPNGTYLFKGDTVMVGIIAGTLNGDYGSSYMSGIRGYGMSIPDIIADSNTAEYAHTGDYMGDNGDQIDDTLYTPNGMVVTGMIAWQNNFFASAVALIYTPISDFFQSYNWNTGDTTNIIKVSTGGTYDATVTNSSGCSSALAPVSVTIDSSPVIIYNCPSNITINNDYGSPGSSQVYWNPPTASNSCNSFPVTSIPALGSFFNMGTTTVYNYTVDDFGDTISCTFQVIVTPSPGPVMLCPNDTTIIGDSTCSAMVSFIPPNAVDYIQSSAYFSYTGGVQTWIVPQGVDSITVQAVGAGGSPDNFYNQQGGGGTSVQTTLAVTAGEVLYITVGGYSGNGSGGFNGGGNASYDSLGNSGGGGGGQTNIGTTGNALTDTLVVAAGGGGAGIGCGYDLGGNGGDPNGYAGLDCGNPDGGGGTQTAGGTGLNNGTYMQGANGTPNTNDGGGGGGGYYGGGSGVIGGGGGGSSYVTSTGSSNTSYTAGDNYWNSGYVYITAFGQDTISSVQVSGPPSGSAFPAGYNYVEFTATDSFGYSSTCGYNVFVTYPHPVLTNPGNMVVNGDPNSCGAYVNFNFNVIDNCYGSYTISNPYSGSLFPYGNTTVTAYAIDYNNDSSAMITFTVDVVDSTGAFIQCPADINRNLDPGVCGAVVTFDTPQLSTTYSCQFPISTNFFFTGNNQQWTVPPGIDSIMVNAYGAMGNGSSVYSYQAQSSGAHVQTTLAVTPGEVLYITVGGVGYDSLGGFNGGGNGSKDSLGNAGGGGGGQSNIGTVGNILDDTLVVAAGGGGSGVAGSGGHGGAPIGQPGTFDYNGNESDGYGATQTAGGAGVNNGSYMQGANGGAGLTFANNDPTNTNAQYDLVYGGGGGGGGYYGGGSGSSGGGGGGSSYVTSTGSSNTSYSTGYNGYTTSGLVTIAYIPAVTIAQTAGLPSGSVFPEGNNAVTFTATTPSGNVATCSFYINVAVPSSSYDTTVCQGNNYSFNGTLLTQSGVYVDTVPTSSGCDSVVTLNLSVTPAPVTSLNQSICSGQAYNFNGQNLTSTGTYIDTLITDGGCDSVVILNLTVNTGSTDSISASICAGQSFSFNGVNLNNTGIYIDTLSNVNGCDSILILNLTVSSFLASTINQTICSGNSYLFNGVSLAASGNYYDTLFAAGGCDSIITLNLTVADSTIGSIDATICQGQSYFFNGTNLTTSGAYIDTLVNSNGCDSILTLNLTVDSFLRSVINQTICPGSSYQFNSVELMIGGVYYDTLSSFGGCDSIIILNLTVSPAVSTTLNDSICNGSNLSFNGQSLTLNGTYYDTLTSVNGCDSIVTLNLTVLPVAATTLNDSICNGSSFSFDGQSLTSNGTYYDTLTSVNGCDSIVTLNLTVLPIAATTLNDSICNGSSFSFNGQALASAGTYFDTLTSVNGCDSIVTLNLTILPVVATMLNDSICNGSSFSFDGQSLTSNGIYYDTLTSVNGCDSIVTLNLTVLPVAATTLDDSICNGSSFSFDGQALASAGIYFDTLTSVNGCDSIVTLNLTILPVVATMLNDSICNGSSFSFDGQSLTSNGIYYDTLTSVNGCDSIVTLNLAVLPVAITMLNDSICNGSSFRFNGQLLTSNGTYYDTLASVNGCDSIVTLNLTVLPMAMTNLTQNICTGSTIIFNSVTLDSSGIYIDTLTSVNGCDSIITLNLSVISFLSTNLTDSICSGFGITFNGQLRTATGTYYDTLTATGGCDSIITFNLTVLPIGSSNLTDTICSGTSINFNGISLTLPGIYYDTLTSAHGCDSIVTLNLTILPVASITLNDSICNGSNLSFNGQSLTSNGTYYDTLTSVNGCDSIVTLNLTVLPVASTVLNDSICNGSNFSFNGLALTSNGTYYDTLTSVNGCDSIVTLNLTILPVVATMLNVSICNGSNFSFNGMALASAGTYFDTLTSVNGCDSIVTLNLTILPVAATILNDSICNGSSFSFNGHALSSAGTYFDTLTSVNGCDSIVTLNLTVLPVASTVLNDSICNGSNFSFNGMALTSNGIYYDTLTSVNGCDSIVTLNLTILPVVATMLNDSICNGSSFSFNGQALASAGTYFDTLTSVNGCDSIVTLNLTVLPVASTVLNDSICNGSSFSFNGQALTSNGTYYDTLTSVNGCDSIVTLNLTVLPVASTVLNDSICNGSNFSFNGLALTSNGTYYDTLTSVNGCDSIVTLNLTILPVAATILNDSICNGSSFSFNGQALASAGTYFDTLTSVNGCDSIVTLNLTILPVAATILNDSICNGSSFSFNGHALSSAGTYFDTLTSVNGCDSIVTLNLTVLPVASTVLNDSICNGSNFSFNGMALTSNGIYYDTLTSVNGCDSIVTLNLTILPVVATMLNDSICNGSSFSFNGQALASAGTYFDTLTSVNGCDSIVTLNLTVLPVASTVLNDSICNGSSFSFNGQALTSNGTYYDTLTSVNGCDSIVTLNLTVLPVASTVLNDSICNGSSFSFNGQALTSNGTYYDTLTSVNGCDSIVTLNLTVLPVASTVLNDSICNGSNFSFNGLALTSNGTYYDTLTSVNGCDSIVTLNLTILPVAATILNDSICNGSSFSFNGQSLTSNGTYYDTLTSVNGCDSTVTLNLIVSPILFSSYNASICNGNTYLFNSILLTTSGAYSDTLISIGGCDSIVSLTLTVTTINDSAVVSGPVCTANEIGAIYQWIDCSNGQPVSGATSRNYTATQNGSYECAVTFDNCTDTTNCVTAIVNGIPAFENYNFNLYPNPNLGNFVIEYSYPGTLQVRIVSSIGNLVTEQALNRSGERFDISSLAAGVYQVMISDGKQLLKVIKVVKQ